MSSSEDLQPTVIVTSSTNKLFSSWNDSVSEYLTDKTNTGALQVHMNNVSHLVYLLVVYHLLSLCIIMFIQ